jgi:hypothetical protein
MNNLVEHRTNQFANSQSSRDLRFCWDAMQLDAQMTEAIDNVADFLRFVEISTRSAAIN